MGGSLPPRREAGLTGTLLRGASTSALGFALRQGLALATALVLARILEPAQVGVYVAGMIFIDLAGSFAGSGFQSGLIQRRDRIEEAAATALFASVAGGIALALAQLAASPLLGDYFDSTTVRDIAAVTSGLLVVNSLGVVPSALLQRRFSFVRRATIEPLMALTYGAVAIVACELGMGPWGLVVGVYTAMTVQTCLLWWAARWRPRPGLASVSLWREMARFARPVVGAEALDRVTTLFPTALIGRVLNPAAIGNFGYAARVATLPRTAQIYIASFALLPAFAHISEDEDRFRAAFLRALRATSAVATPVGLILLPLGPGIVALLFGDRWHEAGPPLAALCLLAAGLAPMDLATEACKARDDAPAVFRLLVVRAIASIGAATALSPLGLVGVAAGLSAGAAVAGLHAIVLVARRQGIPLRLMVAATWRPWAAATLMACSLLLLDRLVLHAGDGGTSLETAGLLALEGALALLVYVGALLALGERDLRGLLSRPVPDSA